MATLTGCEFVGSSSKEDIGPKRYNLIPLPRVVVERQETLTLGPDTRIGERGTDPDLDGVAMYLADRLRSTTGYEVPVGAADPAGPPATIELLIDGSMVEDEGYVLDVSATRVQVSAKRAVGLFYAVQTLRQLLPPEIDAPGKAGGISWTLPAVRIEDSPRFSYRGMHLDVSRHFFSVEFVERYIDLMALYKMNTFHWHLTDDQGWRIEIKKYPKLTEVGSMRSQTVIGRPGPDAVYDGQPYGGFYTQDEIREVVAYARRRFVTVMPEIEMPGHALAALAAYPELACTPGPFATATTWGIFSDIFCPSEQTFQFLSDVLGEVIALFPDAYVHVGGDEVPEETWQASPVAQEVVGREGLASTADLETYFIGRMAAYLTANGRKVVGWDEIVGRGKVEGATIMSWLGEQKAIEETQQGYPVIATPIAYCYFDQAQGSDPSEPPSSGGYLPLDKVYQFEPLPAGVSTAGPVLGGQGNLWSEYVVGDARAEYKILPRMSALSEALWSPPAARSYRDFVARLSVNAKHLDALGVTYARYFASP